MFLKITAKRQVTFPAGVLEALGVKPGDRIELEEGPDGFVLRARHIDQRQLDFYNLDAIFAEGQVCL